MMTLTFVNWCNEVILHFGQLLGISARQADIFLNFGILPALVVLLVIGHITANSRFTRSKLTANICYYASTIVFAITVAFLVVSAVMTIGDLDEIIREINTPWRRDGSSLKKVIKWLASEKRSIGIHYSAKGRVIYGMLFFITAGVLRSSLKRKI